MKKMVRTDSTLKMLVGAALSNPSCSTSFFISKVTNYSFDILSRFDPPLIPKFEGCRQLVAILDNEDTNDNAGINIVYWSDLTSIPELYDLKYEDSYHKEEPILCPDVFGWSHILCPVTPRRSATFVHQNQDRVVPSSFNIDYHNITQHELTDEESKIHTAIKSSYRMSSYFDMTHTISLIVVGDSMNASTLIRLAIHRFTSSEHHISVMWTDKQGIIQSIMFNLLDGLPHFLLLLLTLQRFRPEHWGYGLPNKTSSMSALRVPYQVIKMRCNGQANSKPSKLVYFCPFADTIHRSQSLTGKGTWVMGASQRPPSKNIRSKKDLVAHNDYVVKCSWTNVCRTSEATILQTAHEIGKDSNYIEGHIPELLSASEPHFTTSTTETIRRFFGLSTKGARRFRILVLERLVPISSLLEEEMAAAFLQIFFCKSLCDRSAVKVLTVQTGYRALWIRSIHHLDISVANLMWSKSRKAGVLNDFDLARICTQTLHPDLAANNVGTLAYMALDLLADEAAEGKIERIYRHDAEAFSWWCLVELYMSFKRNEHDVIPRSESGDKWNHGIQGSNKRNRIFKHTIWQSDVLTHLPSPAYSNIRSVTQALASFWGNFHTENREEHSLKSQIKHEYYPRRDITTQEDHTWTNLIAVFRRKDVGGVTTPPRIA
ncbi:hypothetical protein BJ165DRAFT_1405434 [Panaeolus papilionaceus]|nr:hypothetical protein BJ165DRAFT_1405434 [Panaeolus papilionaceus]